MYITYNKKQSVYSQLEAFKPITAINYTALFDCHGRQTARAFTPFVLGINERFKCTSPTDYMCLHKLASVYDEW